MCKIKETTWCTRVNHIRYVSHFRHLGHVESIRDHLLWNRLMLEGHPRVVVHRKVRSSKSHTTYILLLRWLHDWSIHRDVELMRSRHCLGLHLFLARSFWWKATEIVLWCIHIYTLLLFELWTIRATIGIWVVFDQIFLEWWGCFLTLEFVRRYISFSIRSLLNIYRVETFVAENWAVLSKSGWRLLDHNTMSLADRVGWPNSSMLFLG